MSGRAQITNELKEISEPLAQLEAINPYRVPAGYFESLTEMILLRIKAEEATSVDEELEILSPFLKKIDKTPPYTVPQGYFDTLKPEIPSTVTREAKVVRISASRVFRYAAAAVTMGLITVI